MKPFEVQGRAFVVITSINPPTKAVRGFARLAGYNTVVVGDRKTPKDWNCAETTFIPREEQTEGKLAQYLPENQYCRKMYGYLHAIHHGAEIIVDTDDDNIPYDTFPKARSGSYDPHLWEGTWDLVDGGLGFVNVYQYYTKNKIWPRGLPLSLIRENFQLDQKVQKKSSRVGIWQGLADLDPDVDAIYRLVSNEECRFEQRDPIVLSEGSISPFNSQNTVFAKELFPLLYLPVTVTFRFTDILRGLVAQPLMWLEGYTLGFTEATVYQERNPHNFMTDFRDEIDVYLNCEKVVEVASKVSKSNNTLQDNLYNVYSALAKEGIVQASELDALGGWLSDIEQR